MLVFVSLGLKIREDLYRKDRVKGEKEAAGHVNGAAGAAKDKQTAESEENV